MSKQGERSAPADDDWWNRLYDETSPDTGAGASTPGDTLDDRFASATHAVSVPEPPREAAEDGAPGEVQETAGPGEVQETVGPGEAWEETEPGEAWGETEPGEAWQSTPQTRGGREAGKALETGEGQEASDASEPEDAAEPHDVRSPLRDGGREPGRAEEGGARQAEESHRRPPAWWEKGSPAPWEADPYVPSDARPLPSPRGEPAEPPPTPETVNGPLDAATPPPPVAPAGATGAPPASRPASPADEPPIDEHPAGKPSAERPASDEPPAPRDAVAPLPRRSPPSVPPVAGGGASTPGSTRPWDAPEDPRVGRAAVPPRHAAPPAVPLGPPAPPEPRPWMPPAPEPAAPAIRDEFPLPPEDSAPVEGPPRPRVGFVGFRPPTYDPEPTSLPLAASGALDRVVPDTVLDGARYGTYTLRAASVRGDSARYRGEPRRDALLTARFGGGADALVLVAVATGARAAENTHRAAADACEWIAEAVCRSHARLADDIKDARAEALKSGLHRLTDRTYGKLRARAAELGLGAGEYATSLRCLLLSADPRVRLRVFFGVGTGGLFRLRDHEWEDLEPGLPLSTDGYGRPEGAGPFGLPPETPEGDRLTIDFGIPQLRPSLPDAPVPEPDQPFRFHASTARAGDTLLLCGDGLAEPLRGEPGLAGALGARWSGPEAPSLVEYLADVQLRVKGYADDRTAVGVWEA